MVVQGWGKGVKFCFEYSGVPLEDFKQESNWL